MKNEKNQIPQTLLNEKQAAKYLGLSHRTLQMRRYLHLPPAYIKIGRAVRYELEALDAVKDDGRIDPQSIGWF